MKSFIKHSKDLKNVGFAAINVSVFLSYLPQV